VRSYPRGSIFAEPLQEIINVFGRESSGIHGEESTTRRSPAQFVVHRRADELGLGDASSLGLILEPSLEFLGEIDGGALHAIHSAIRWREPWGGRRRTGDD